MHAHYLHVLQQFVAAVATTRQVIFGALPDRARAAAHYGAMAPGYELRTLGGDQGRRELVGALSLQPGEIVLDVGCGTGRNFEQIQQRIGPAGRLVGIEPSPEMLARARALVQRRGWTNVELVLAGAEEAAIPVTADAVLFCAVHDVMRSPAALANVLGRVRDGGRVAVGGPKWVLAACLAQSRDVAAQPPLRDDVRGLPAAVEPPRRPGSRPRRRGQVPRRRLHRQGNHPIPSGPKRLRSAPR